MIKLTDTAAIELHLSTLAPFTGSNFSGAPGAMDTEGMDSHIMGWGEHIRKSAAAAVYTVRSYNTAIAWTADGTNWTILAENPGRQTTAKHLGAVSRALGNLNLPITYISMHEKLNG